MPSNSSTSPPKQALVPIAPALGTQQQIHSDKPSFLATQDRRLDSKRLSISAQSSPLPSSPQISSSSSSKKFQCPHCPQTFTRHHNLKSHLLIHSQEKKFICQTCSSKFRRIYDLKRHLKLHTGERPYLCEKCGRRFARGDALIRHIKTTGTCSSAFEDGETEPNPAQLALEQSFEKHVNSPSETGLANDNAQPNGISTIHNKRGSDDISIQKDEFVSLADDRQPKSLEIGLPKTLPASPNAASPIITNSSHSNARNNPHNEGLDLINDHPRATLPPPSSTRSPNTPLVPLQQKLPSLDPEIRHSSSASGIDRRFSEPSASNLVHPSALAVEKDTSSHHHSLVPTFRHDRAASSSNQYGQRESLSKQLPIRSYSTILEDRAVIANPSSDSSLSSSSSATPQRRTSASPSISSIMNPAPSKPTQSPQFSSSNHFPFHEHNTLPPPAHLNIGSQKPVSHDAAASLKPAALASSSFTNSSTTDLLSSLKTIYSVAPPIQQKREKTDPWMLVQMLETRVRALEERLNSAEGRISFLEGQVRMA